MQRNTKRKSSDSITTSQSKPCRTSVMGRYCRRDLTCITFILVAIFLAGIQVFWVYPHVTGRGKLNIKTQNPQPDNKELDQVPTILDWTNHFMFDGEQLKTCTLNERPYQCKFTSNRNAILSNSPVGITFYGTDMDLVDLPLPRKPNHVWVLSHEESPKNNIIFSFKGMMELFNFTSTFRRESNLPLTTQYLRNVDQLESKKYVKSYDEKVKYAKDEGLAPILYVQSDCGTPSDRDHLVKMLSKHIKIDSYGTCLHNKDLPKHLADPIEGMTHADFIELFSKYKFAITMENGICTDYITEKFWRPLYVGTIPIVLGSPSIQDFAPDEHSILDVNNYKSVQELVTHIESIGSSEREYNSYRKFKKSGGVTNILLRDILEHREWTTDMDVELNHDHGDVPNFPEYYSCKICQLMHNISDKGMKYQASVDHYGCPFPLEFADENDLSKKRPFTDMWHAVWKQTGQKVKAFLEVSDGGRSSFKPVALNSRHQEHMMNDID